MAGTRNTSIAVQSLSIHPRILSALKRGGFIQVSSVLEESPAGLSKRTGLSNDEVKGVLEEASRAILSKSPAPPSTALSLYQAGLTQRHWGRLSVGCDLLDTSLRGGLLVPGLTEIAGTSAAGKTQLALQLCLNSQLPRTDGGLAAGAVYICTEDVFPTKRLHQLTDYFSRKYVHTHPTLTTKYLSDNIFVEHVATTSALVTQLDFKLPALLETGRVRLVIVDSIAALFRAEYGVGQVAQRAHVLQTCGGILHRLCDKYRVAVVCINQVTAMMGGGGGGGGVTPALGLAWASQVGTRIMLTRDETLHSDIEYSKAPLAVKRQMEVTFSPHLPHLTTMEYYITSGGVHARPQPSSSSSSSSSSSDCCN